MAQQMNDEQLKQWAWEQVGTCVITNPDKSVRYLTLEERMEKADALLKWVQSRYVESDPATQSAVALEDHQGRWPGVSGDRLWPGIPSSVGGVS